LPEFEDIRSSGMELAANLVLEHKYDIAKEIFAKLLDIRSDDVEVPISFFSKGSFSKLRGVLTRYWL